MALYLYTTINNIRQMQLLMMNPKEFASISQHEQGKDGDFKRNPTLEGMLAYLRQQIFGSHVRQTDVRTRERLLRELEGSSRKRRSAQSSEEETPSKSRRTTSRRSRSASISPEEQYSGRPSTSRSTSTTRTRRTSYAREENRETKRMAEVLRTSSSEQQSDVFLKHSTPRSDRRKTPATSRRRTSKAHRSSSEAEHEKLLETRRRKATSRRSKTAKSSSQEESEERLDRRTDTRRKQKTAKRSSKTDKSSSQEECQEPRHTRKTDSREKKRSKAHKSGSEAQPENLLDKRKEKPTKTKGKTNKSCPDEETEAHFPLLHKPTSLKPTSHFFTSPLLEHERKKLLAKKQAKQPKKKQRKTCLRIWSKLKPRLEQVLLKNQRQNRRLLRSPSKHMITKNIKEE